ncbi:hypothetical protein HETIRDRAFT_451214 [Heterobasidion irregulare TC 32-1]|uniref:Uncharacterized protein n=1 Tax=Heterobasidion irregulare (strain TC 32-1) TaxID=747525 RepID=W4K8M9_HETIT|nr:uncharacterized protein HETIRDRAFT_451214 [Heterobasidion irregulare TC 32-1]ETW81416.1 hypothetical protein HETIRDRAFT_451214 [Heterobasidion irregulare TC 32-1]
MRARMGMPWDEGLAASRSRSPLSKRNRGAVSDDDGGGGGGGGEVDWRARTMCEIKIQKKARARAKKHNRKSTSPPRINISLLRSIPSHQIPAPSRSQLQPAPTAPLARPRRLPTTVTVTVTVTDLPPLPRHLPAPRTIPGHRAPHVIFTPPRPDSIPDWPSEARVRQAHALGTPRRPPPPSSPRQPPAASRSALPPPLGSRAPFLSPSALGPPPTTVRARPRLAHQISFQPQYPRRTRLVLLLLRSSTLWRSVRRPKVPAPLHRVVPRYRATIDHQPLARLASGWRLRNGRRARGSPESGLSSPPSPPVSLRPSPGGSPHFSPRRASPGLSALGPRGVSSRLVSSRLVGATNERRTRRRTYQLLRAVSDSDSDSNSDSDSALLQATRTPLAASRSALCLSVHPSPGVRA